MHEFLGSFYTLLALACVLGIKHGLDADHLATIDGLTRFNMRVGKPKLARLCGMLFSLGHGAVVCLVAVVANSLFHQTAMPSWLDSFGAYVSIFFLMALGLVNLHAVISTPANELVSLIGVKGRWLKQLNQNSHPMAIAFVGALFALSFDTLTQATLFSAASTQFGGAMFALLLALSFTVGMLMTDAANGLWISHMLRRADATALRASRIMGITVALLSFVVAGFGLSKLLSPALASWQDGKELLIGCLVLLAVLMSFFYARWAGRQAIV